MKSVKSITIFALVALICSSAMAQLIATSVPLSSIAVSIRADTAFVNSTLLNVNSSVAGFTWNSYNFASISPLSAQSLKVGVYSDGIYKLKLSYIAEDSVGENIIGIGNSVANSVSSNLFSTYQANNFSYDITASTATFADIHNSNLQYNASSWQSDSNHFKWFISYNNNGPIFLIFNDDLGHSITGSDHDYNDSVILVETFYTPFQDTPGEPVPVPESSAMAFFAGLGLLIVAAFKKFNK